MALVVIAILTILACFLIGFGFQRAELWNDYDNNIHKPSVRDLNECPVYILEDYVTNVIVKYNEFCQIEKKIKNLQNDDLTNLCTFTSFLPLYYTIYTLLHYKFNLLSKFWAVVFSIALLLIIILLPLWIFSKIFNDPPCKTYSELKQEYKIVYKAPRFPISEDQDISNYIFEKYYNYLLSIYDKEKIRSVTQTIGLILLYVLFLCALCLYK